MIVVLAGGEMEGGSVGFASLYLLKEYEIAVEL
jgi:hypothetical protein